MFPPLPPYPCLERCFSFPAQPPRAGAQQAISTASHGCQDRAAVLSPSWCHRRPWGQPSVSPMPPKPLPVAAGAALGLLRAGRESQPCRGVLEHGAGFGPGCVVAEKSIKNKSCESAARAVAIVPVSGRLWSAVVGTVLRRALALWITIVTWAIFPQEPSQPQTIARQLFQSNVPGLAFVWGCPRGHRGRLSVCRLSAAGLSPTFFWVRVSCTSALSFIHTPSLGRAAPRVLLPAACGTAQGFHMIFPLAGCWEEDPAPDPVGMRKRVLSVTSDVGLCSVSRMVAVGSTWGQLLASQIEKMCWGVLFPFCLHRSLLASHVGWCLETHLKPTSKWIAYPCFLNW